LLDEDRRLLHHLAGQAATAVRNLHRTAELTARLAVIRRQAADLVASRARIVTAQDAERRRIQRDQHDGVQQQIVVLSAKLALARQRLDRGDGSARELLAELQRDVTANVVKHAGAQQVRIRLARPDGRLALDACDDGVGFDARTTGGLGLSGLADRISTVDGVLEASRAPGRRGDPFPVRRRGVCVRAVPQRHGRPGVPAQGPHRRPAAVARCPPARRDRPDRRG
jgi:signal transduction histidine kinase